MARRNNPPLDLKTYLAKVPRGTTTELRKKRIIFSQGSPANAVFYIKEGKVKLTVLSERGKEAVVAILGSGDFLVKGASRASRCAWPRRPR
jgi:CRP/FNR family cyclic AMP-dependent transcriptional regulator